MSTPTTGDKTTPQPLFGHFGPLGWLFCPLGADFITLFRRLVLSPKGSHV